MKISKSPKILSKNIPGLILLLLAFNLFAGTCCNDLKKHNETLMFDEFNIINDQNQTKEFGTKSGLLDKILWKLETFYNNRHEKEKLYSIFSHDSSKDEIPTKSHNDSFICKGCIKSFNFMHNLIKNTYGKTGILEIFNLICRVFLKYSNAACQIYIGGYAPVIIDSLLDHYMTGEYICSYSPICSYLHVKKLNPDVYAKELLKDKPKKELPDVPENPKKWRVMHLTDMHTDLLYTEGSVGECNDPTCCQAHNEKKDKSNTDKKLKFLGTEHTKILSTHSDIFKSENKTPSAFYNDNTLAGKWGFLGKCDLPLKTTTNFFDWVFKNNETIPDFIIWTGDNPTHSIWDLNSQDEVFKITKILTDLMDNKLVKHNLNIPVYPSLGNHEKFPNDQYYPYDSQRENLMLKTIGEYWKKWLSPEAYETFINYGYYSQKHLDTNLRIISYNCLYCDSINFYLIKNPTDPSNQLNWLENELRKAEQNNEVVYLISHIPYIDGFFLNECAKRFKALVDRFSYIIRGQFAGHTHSDEINIQTEYFKQGDKEKEFTGVVFTAPSFTTYSYMNPSFRIFEIDTETKLPLNYLQYGFNMTLANLYEENVPKWEIRYNATEFFKVKYLNDLRGIKEFIINLKNDEQAFGKMLSHYFAEGKSYLNYKNDKKSFNQYYCRFISEDFEDYFQCLNGFSILKDGFIYDFLNYITGKWYIKETDNQ